MQYLIGLDLGQTTDFTALAVLEVSRRPRGPYDTEPTYLVNHLQRFKLGTPYPRIVQEVRALLATPPLPGSRVAVDQTGVGRPVVDMFRQAGLQGSLKPITITGGLKASADPNGDHHVPKKELVSVLQVLLGTRRLKIVQSLPDARTLQTELQNFHVKVTTAANEQFGAWREGQHDDLVLAVALAAWLGEHYPVSWDGRLGDRDRGNCLAAGARGVFNDPKRTPEPW